MVTCSCRGSKISASERLERLFAAVASRPDASERFTKSQYINFSSTSRPTLSQPFALNPFHFKEKEEFREKKTNMDHL